MRHDFEWGQDESASATASKRFDTIVDETTLEDADKYDAVLVGEPYDGGVTGRPGAREGPSAIRDSLASIHTHHLDAGPVASVGDLGSVELPTGESVSTVHEQVREAVEPIYDAEIIPIFLGGDGSLTYANVAGLLAATAVTDGGYLTDGGFDDDDESVGDVEHFDPTSDDDESEETTETDTSSVAAEERIEPAGDETEAEDDDAEDTEPEEDADGVDGETSEDADGVDEETAEDAEEQKEIDEDVDENAGETAEVEESEEEAEETEAESGVDEVDKEATADETEAKREETDEVETDAEQEGEDAEQEESEVGASEETEEEADESGVEVAADEEQAETDEKAEETDGGNVGTTETVVADDSTSGEGRESSGADEGTGGQSESTTDSVGVISLDARLDCHEVAGQPTNRTAYRQLFEEGLDALAALGVRHFESGTAAADYLREQGGEVVTAEEVGDDPVDATDRALATVDDVDTVYVSVDLSVLDTTDGPGVSTPAPGGISSRELFRIVRLLASEDRLAGIEFVETAPQLDRDGRTVDAAATAVAHALAVVGD